MGEPKKNKKDKKGKGVLGHRSFTVVTTAVVSGGAAFQAGGVIPAIVVGMTVAVGLHQLIR